MNNNQYIYLPGNYFGEKWCEHHKISNSKKIVILGKICDSFRFNTFYWSKVYIFADDQYVWIFNNHIKILPLNVDKYLVVKGIIYLKREYNLSYDENSKYILCDN